MKANEKKEPNERALMSISILFQGRYFHPCVGLMCFIRWGEFILDTRDLRHFLGLEPESLATISRIDSVVFEKRMKQITEKVRGRDFLELIELLDKYY